MVEKDLRETRGPSWIVVTLPPRSYVAKGAATMFFKSYESAYNHARTICKDLKRHAYIARLDRAFYVPFKDQEESDT